MSTRHKKSEKLIKKHLLSNMWDLKKVGLYKTVEDMLTQKYSSKKGKCYSFEDWEYLMYTDRYVFKELCHEFHSTYILDENPKDMKDKDFMRFSLLGVTYSMSLEDFTRCLKIYSKKQMDEKDFSEYIWSGARVSYMNDINKFDPKKVWKEFSSRTSWSPCEGEGEGDGHGKVSRIDIDAVEYRLIHLFLSLNVFHRSENTDKVTLSDLWYLEQIRSKTCVNIPYCVAYYLKHFAATASAICGGHFVTLIAQYVEIDISGAPTSFVQGQRWNPRISLEDYRNANIISVSSRGMTIYEPGLEEKEPLYGFGIEDEDEEEQQQRGGTYEVIMANLEEVQLHPDVTLTEKQLTEIQKKIESQLLGLRLRIGDVSGHSQVEEDKKKTKKKRRRSQKRQRCRSS